MHKWSGQVKNKKLVSELHTLTRFRSPRRKRRPDMNGETSAVFYADSSEITSFLRRTSSPPLPPLPSSRWPHRISFQDFQPEPRFGVKNIDYLFLFFSTPCEMIIPIKNNWRKIRYFARFFRSFVLTPTPARVLYR